MKLTHNDKQYLVLAVDALLTQWLLAEHSSDYDIPNLRLLRAKLQQDTDLIETAHDAVLTTVAWRPVNEFFKLEE